jgi:BlaI family transcriptional regulator, penicillinase repressor
MADLQRLSRRERQIMDFLFSRSSGTVADVQAGIADPPSYSSVRAMLGKLEEKGFIAHEEIDRAYVYRPTIAPEQARGTAVQHLLKTFFGGSTEQAVAALLKFSDKPLSAAELDRLAHLVDDARAKENGR